jgi:peptidoglycan LD-endopeptidase LytH
MQRVLPTRIDHRRRQPAPWVWVVGLLTLALVLGTLIAWSWRVTHRARPAKAAPVPVAARPPVVYPWNHLRAPTARILAPVTDITTVVQPTESGKPESGLYGSTRTTDRGGRLMSRFHEGVDIAPVAKARDGRALDAVHAVATGQVAYANRIAGNSSYGKYVVLLHQDPLGEVYSLYAHLAEIQDGLAAGTVVAAGDPVGVMGHTSTLGIPQERSHLHLEIGLINNHHFLEWFRAQKLTPDHGNFNGQNFLGVNPLSFFAAQYANPNLHFAGFLSTVPVAFEVVLRTRQLPDYFQRYAGLWHGRFVSGMAMTMDCSENGLPLAGRMATDEESARLRGVPCIVRNANETALGRNGCHLVSRSSGDWALTGSGQRWIEILCYPSGLISNPAAAAREDLAATSSPTRSKSRR